MTKLASRNWSAKDEAISFKGSQHRIVVEGEVETLNTNEHAKLKEAHPQGINPRILILDLEVSQSPGAAGDIVSWKKVTFEKGVSRHEYDEVYVRGNLAKEVKIKVTEFTI